MTQVMVLCAGYGTRLGSLSLELPKPLLPVGDRSMLRTILDVLKRQGQSDVVINTHHLPERFAEVSPDGLRIRRLFEPEILGTAGGIFNARKELEAPLLIWNGDICATPPIDLLLARAESSGVCLLAARAGKAGTGTLGLDRDGRVVRLRGERFGEERVGADYIGIMALSKAVLESMPERGCLIGDVCLPRLRHGAAIDTLEYAGAWTDIGNVAEYQRLNLDWLLERKLPAYHHHSASLSSSVNLEQSFVHAGARVEGEGAVRRCIVFEGARATAPMTDKVVLARGDVISVTHVRS